MIKELVCAAFLTQAVPAPGTLFTHPALSQNAIKVFQFLTEFENPGDGSRILLIGDAPNWINQLRWEGFVVYGVSLEDVDSFYYQKVATYQILPFRTAFFKIVCVLVEADVGMFFEADRLLVPDGFLAVSPQGMFNYEKFLSYLYYTRLGLILHEMTVWQKHNGWERRDKESA